jgi:uncharacterized protein YkwD
MRRLRFLLPAFAFVATLLTLPAAAGAATACRGAHLDPSPANAATVRHATLCLLNRQRAAHGLPRLRQQHSLTRAAAKYAHLMVAQRFFDHVSPAGTTVAQRIKRTNYLNNTRAWSIGENIAWGSRGAATPARIVTAWMHSAGHRANILTRQFRQIGIGSALGDPSGDADGATYSTDFGG